MTEPTPEATTDPTTTAAPVHRQLLVAFNLSAIGPVVLERAVTLACSAPEYVLHVMTVIDPGAGSAMVPVGADGVDYRYADQVTARVAELLGETLRRCRAPAEVHCFVHARIGHPADEILALAREIGAEHIFLGIHEMHGVRRLLAGSTSKNVVNGAECTVTIVRDGAYPAVKLLEVIDAPVAAHKHYSPPHRYSYRDGAVITRPLDWPIL